MLRAYVAREERDQERVGYLAWATAMSSGAKKKGGQPFQLRDFIPKRQRRRADAEKPKPSVESMIKFAEMVTAAWGGKDLRHGKNNAR